MQDNASLDFGGGKGAGALPLHEEGKVDGTRSSLHDVGALLDVADRIVDVTDPNSVSEAACQSFRETSFGKQVLRDLHENGIVNIPYGVSEDDAAQKASVVVGAAKTLLLGVRFTESQRRSKGRRGTC